jgi:tetratricopeptide (TPR) repeat protein
VCREGKGLVFKAIVLLICFAPAWQATALCKDVSANVAEPRNVIEDEALHNLADSYAKHLEKAKFLEGVPRPDPAHKKSAQLYEHGRELMLANSFDLAIAKYSEYIEQFKKESQTIKHENKEEHNYYLAWGYQCRGFCYLNERKYERGIQDLSEAIKLRPRYATNYTNRAKAYRRIGNLKLAQEDEAKVRSLPHITGDTLSDLSREFASPAKGSK